MDAPPVNRLLQLLRQKPSDTSELSHSSQTLVSPGESISQAIPQSNTPSATESDIPPIPKVAHRLLLKVTHRLPGKETYSLSLKVADSLLEVAHRLLLKVTHRLPGKETYSLSLKVADSLLEVAHRLLLKVT